ncbi:hypothetical protein [Ereboglobus luteus]|uniref:Alginate lyase 2 domain-containing protein n=1 Tax=Ereboglobus luteus TaxID=1796921 RepID=A0A2U8DZZ9_9BACT|nr:hypothetical protein [Ereboglobus luteus]AWI08131.1 hypothetical protein CKA38_01625 [Ereboglobus luteus]
MSFVHSLRSCLPAVALALICSTAHAFTFDSENVFSANFREMKKSGNTAWKWDSSSKSMRISPVASGAYAHAKSAADASKPAQTTFTVSEGETLSVEIGFSAGTPRSSLGIYIIDPKNENKGYLALYNIDNTGNDDLLRFVTNAAPLTSGAGGISKAKGFSAPGLELGEKATLRFTYGIKDKKGVMTLAVSNGAGVQVHSASYRMTEVGKPLTTFEIGFRYAAQNGKGDFVINNFDASVARSK